MAKKRKNPERWTVRVHFLTNGSSVDYRCLTHDAVLKEVKRWLESNQTFSPTSLALLRHGEDETTTDEERY